MKLALSMKRKTQWVYLLAVVFAGILHAQDLTGNWQGTLTPPQGSPLRLVLQITRDAGQTLTAKIYSIDQGPEATGWIPLPCGTPP